MELISQVAFFIGEAKAVERYCIEYNIPQYLFSRDSDTLHYTRDREIPIWSEKALISYQISDSLRTMISSVSAGRPTIVHVLPPCTTRVIIIAPLSPIRTRKATDPDLGDLVLRVNEFKISGEAEIEIDPDTLVLSSARPLVRLDDVRYRCPECPAVLTTEDLLYIHRLTHIGRQSRRIFY